MRRAIKGQIVSRLVAAVSPVLIGGLMLAAGGCETQSFLDPARGNGAFSKDPLTVDILPSLNVGLDEEEAEFTNARDITEADQNAAAIDYTIGSNDVLAITVNDLQQPNTAAQRTVRVSETGKVSLDYLPNPLQVKGLTEAQLERAIVDAYREAGILNNAVVSAQVVEARGRQYTVTGAVANPASYVIYQSDFRLLDALTQANGVNSQPGLNYVYIIRKLNTDSATPAQGTDPATAPTNDPLAPSSLRPVERSSVLLARVAQDPLDPTAPAPTVQPATAPADPSAVPSGAIVVVDGKEQVLNPETPATAPVIADAPSENTITPVTTQEAFAFNDLREPTDREVIRVPYKALIGAQLKYNIVIRPGDLIILPAPQRGVYYMGGNVAGPGAYELVGNKVTLTQAIDSARGLNEVAWPSRTEIVRRLPNDKSVFVRVDLAKIYAGQQPDIYLKPDDRVNVGTNALAPFLAAIRNGFRVTYGFGFLYDRNFAPERNNNN